jgi:hypothetical protein
VRTEAAAAEMDPFLLAALVYHQSACDARLQSPQGFGLLRIHPALYNTEGAPPAPGEKDAWRTRALLNPASNIRLGVELLKMWQETHQGIDMAFGGVTHREALSHFIWGDVVRSSGNEDLVLTHRRRALAAYNDTPNGTTESSLGVTFVCPLEGTPRVATSGPGEARAGGRRRHRGIDITASVGEPVRAIADGTVIFAGVNFPARPRKTVPPSQIHRYRRRSLGAGGIYICIAHNPQRHIVSCYMHLDRYHINEGDTVTAGQEIGRVGVTGVKLSPPHLHFEIRANDKTLDPAKHMVGLVIPPKETQTYRNTMRARRTRMAAKARARAAAAAEAQQKL